MQILTERWGRMEQWLAEGLEAGGLDRAALSRLKGSDPRKVVLAELL